MLDLPTWMDGGDQRSFWNGAYTLSKRIPSNLPFSYNYRIRQDVLLLGGKNTGFDAGVDIEVSYSVNSGLADLDMTTVMDAEILDIPLNTSSIQRYFDFRGEVRNDLSYSIVVGKGQIAWNPF